MFLVRLRHSMDDIPLYLTKSKQEALEYAKTASWDVPQRLLDNGVSPDCNTPCTIDIVKFVDGLAVCSLHYRRVWEEEGDDEEEVEYASAN